MTQAPVSGELCFPFESLIVWCETGDIYTSLGSRRRAGLYGYPAPTQRGLMDTRRATQSAYTRAHAREPVRACSRARTRDRGARAGGECNVAGAGIPYERAMNQAPRTTVRILDEDRAFGSVLSKDDLSAARRYAVADVHELQPRQLPARPSCSTGMACSDCLCSTACWYARSGSAGGAAARSSDRALC